MAFLRWKRLRRQESRRRGAIRDELWAWDPVKDNDPFDPHLPADEYDWLIDPLLSRLDAGQSAEQIRVFLARALHDRYGITGDPASLLEVAKRIVECHSRLSSLAESRQS